MTEQNPSVELTRLVNGYQASQAIHVVATLGVADLLTCSRAPTRPFEIASTTATGGAYAEPEAPRMTAWSPNSSYNDLSSGRTHVNTSPLVGPL